jgi:hypothetical protein
MLKLDLKALINLFKDIYLYINILKMPQNLWDFYHGANVGVSSPKANFWAIFSPLRLAYFALHFLLTNLEDGLL